MNLTSPPAPDLPSTHFEETERCIKCGLCLSVCPTYREELIETSSPRGRIAILRAQARGRLSIGAGLAEQMHRCLSCGACSEACPSAVRVDRLVEAAVSYIQEANPRLSRWKRIFASVLEPQGRFEVAVRLIRLYQRLGMRGVVGFLGKRGVLPRNLNDLNEFLPALPPRPLRHLLPGVVPSSKNGRYRVGFFLGCVQSAVFAEGSQAAFRVLSRQGCEVVVPSSLRCCGMPALGYGDLTAARNLARHNIDLFGEAKVEAIVTDCATCGAALKRYKELLADDPQYASKAASFSDRVKDINQFLVHLTGDAPLGELQLRVTYHDPCHLARSQGLREEPRLLLQSIPGVELVEMKEADWCCGNAGSYIVTHTGLSLAILDRKMSHIAETRAEVVVTSCAGCQMQLGLGIRRWKMKAEVLHPVQLLDRAQASLSKTAVEG